MIDDFMREVKLVRAVLVVSLIIWVEIPSRPEVLEEERFIALSTSLSVTKVKLVIEGGAQRLQDYCIVVEFCDGRMIGLLLLRSEYCCIKVAEG